MRAQTGPPVDLWWPHAQPCFFARTDIVLRGHLVQQPPCTSGLRAAVEDLSQNNASETTCTSMQGKGQAELPRLTPSCRIVVSYHVMSCHVMSSQVKSRQVKSYHVMSCHVMSCHVRSCHVTSCHVMSRRVASFSSCVTLVRLSRHVMSCRSCSFSGVMLLTRVFDASR